MGLQGKSDLIQIAVDSKSDTFNKIYIDLPLYTKVSKFIPYISTLSTS